MSIRLKKNKEKAVLNYHPWIFSGAIEKEEPGLTPGQTVRVLSYEGKFLAWGHYAPDSQIRIRLFSFEEAESDLNPGFWTRRWESVYRSKKEWLDPKFTNSFRFLHSEGDLSPGFIVDCYANAAVMQLRTPGSKLHKEELVSFLKEKGFTTVLEKGEKSDSGEPAHLQWYCGDEKQVRFLENGHSFLADLENGQKTGFFLDQRENRSLLGKFAKGKKVLNTFGYSGAFSVYALANGAESVHTLDISKSAIDLCAQNLGLNFSEEWIQSKHKGLVSDSFRYLKEMEAGAYDLIILDPPAFTKHISTVNQATRGYKDINLKAMSKIKPGGIIFTFSCSQHISPDLFKKIVFGAAKDAGKRVRVLYQMTQGPDHGFSIFHPEGEYLKGLVIQVDSFVSD
ncbi:class I SAM-dependent rRNA methyltransferase [Leptospira idonii]|uniref:Class I SAM-dependent rRNA methyltransferase n=1 Tax=Leptospira idonii TaxID=1193500 RepID=A0A4R9LWL6_9LEPT|nr:class I SAM-dependent rRNA methyltransferase [Leptospira idonii]TGN18674.1 class I SAM-dependent rRNA methyltransferase [Leptospira idonii]